MPPDPNSTSTRERSYQAIYGKFRQKAVNQFPDAWAETRHFDVLDSFFVTFESMQMKASASVLY